MGTLVAIMVVCLVVLLLINNAEKNKQDKHDALINRYRKMFNIPQKAKLINYCEGIPEIENHEVCEESRGPAGRFDFCYNVLFWTDDDYFNFAISPVWDFSGAGVFYQYMINKKFFDIVSDVTKPSTITSIPKNNILCYSRVGDFFTKTSGGGSNLGGAIVGGVLAGGAGAVIGSRSKINTEVVDRRDTMLAIKTDVGIHNVFFGPNTIDVFLRFAPEKDINVVNMQNNVDSKHVTASTESNYTAFDKLDKLIKLKEKGVITEKEFDEKKKKLLDMI